MIRLDITTEDPSYRDIIRRYWKLDTGSRFAEPLSAIEEDHGLTRGGILSIVRTHSRAISKVHQCGECGREKEFHSRKEYRETPTQTSYCCAECQAEGTEGEEPHRSTLDSVAPDRPNSDRPASSDLPSDGLASNRSSAALEAKADTLGGRLHQVALLLSEVSSRLERLTERDQKVDLGTFPEARS